MTIASNQYPNEIALVQNPTMGAYALWRFSLAFQSRNDSEPSIALAFMVLPLILHAATRSMIRSTQIGSGLALFAGKLGEHREDLLAIHDRTLEFKELTLESIVLGEQAGLFTLNIDAASIKAVQITGDGPVPPLPKSLKWLIPACEKIGVWFAEISSEQVAKTLCVEF
ncbi:three component ABC system middle component [Janthinobacterium sp. 64]|uniref:three component ABC system middle component n=1 Tax=Janthinobacterium sp. 64 TaxID=2035208 RepID=UPI0012FD5A99|nr:three component ABC system middle component [Janthinobacterium sp. 64]